jgi:hypothetical protein
MPFYPLRCTFNGCGMDFEHFTTAALYVQSADDGFRDIRCSYCGSFGSAERTYPPDSAPANLTVKGTWGRHASPGLKGKDFYTKQERDRQLAEAGSSGGVYDGEGSAPLVSSATKTYAAGKDGKVKLVKRKNGKLIPVEPVVKPSDLIREYANENNGLVDFAGLVEKTKLDKRKLNGGIMGAIRAGWLERATGEGDRVYRLS